MSRSKQLLPGTATTRLLIVVLMSSALSLLHVRSASALEIIPSLGVSKATDANAGDAKAYGGLALRTSLLPFLKLEGGIAYRQESFSNDDVVLRMWPITASVWLSPLPMLYAGGGVGWYRTTVDYRSTLPFKDTITQKTGIHLGGGLQVPLAPRLGLDLNGRYVFMQKDKELNLPTKFNPDFWTTSLGLAIKF